MSVSCILQGQDNSGIKLDEQKFIQEFEDVTEEVKSAVGVDVLKQSVDTHIADKKNPHKVTTKQIGAAKESEVGSLYLWERKEKITSITYSSDTIEYMFNIDDTISIIFNGFNDYKDFIENPDVTFEFANDYGQVLQTFDAGNAFYFIINDNYTVVYYFDGNSENIELNNEAPQGSVVCYHANLDISYGDIEYVTDSDKSVYPESGEQDGYIYTLKGQIGELGNSGDYYTKEETLTDETAMMYNFNEKAIPNDVFNWIGKYNEYWWRRRKNLGWQLFIDNDITEIYITPNAPSDSPRKYSQCAKEITIDINTGEINLVNPIEIVTANYSSSKDFSPTVQGLTTLMNLAPCYFYNETDDKLLYIPAEATWVTTTSWNSSATTPYAVYPNGSNKQCNIVFNVNDLITVTVKDVIKQKDAPSEDTWEYIHSIYNNAYPILDTNIQLDGYEYEYLGVPFDNAVTAMGASKIEIGSYTGTGTYGADNPNMLTFGLAPKLVIIASVSPTTIGNKQGVWILNGVQFNGVESTHITVEGRTMSWYSTQNANHQLNEESKVHNYIAIG